MSANYDDVEIPEALYDEIHDAISSMKVNSFYPDGAREAGKPYVEHCRGPMGSCLFHVYRSDGFPEAAALDHAYKAIEIYVYLAYGPAS